ncbi:MAG: YbaB/EbfC family nucleoid-associated protein [Clostridia bacterium]|nr:YbaB/EbfC family nucleoid-associated protein [Clostridia bacterium]
MARGFAGGYGGGNNMQQLMRQAQKMQQEMERVKNSMSELFVEAESAGGAVKVVANCERQVTELVIDPSIVDPDDVETLQDCIIVAINEAMEKAEAKYNAEMSKVTGGISF